MPARQHQTSVPSPTSSFIHRGAAERPEERSRAGARERGTYRVRRPTSDVRRPTSDKIEFEIESEIEFEIESEIESEFEVESEFEIEFESDSSTPDPPPVARIRPLPRKWR